MRVIDQAERETERLVERAKGDGFDGEKVRKIIE